MLIRLEDKLASSGCQHMNLGVAQLGDTQVIFQFGGESIPGLLQVVSTHDWGVEAAPGVGVFQFNQNFKTKTYLPEGRWAEARQNFRRQAGALLLEDEAIDRFIRSRLPEDAARLDEELAMTQENPAQFLLAVFIQQELAGGAAKLAALNKIAKRQAEALEEAQVLARQIARAGEARQAALTDVKTKLTNNKTVNLADLKAIINSNNQSQ